MEQILMSQELSDNELEQVIGAGGHFGGHHCKPKHHEGCDHHFKHHCYEPPKPCHHHEYDPCKPLIHCHVDAHVCI